MAASPRLRVLQDVGDLQEQVQPWAKLEVVDRMIRSATRDPEYKEALGKRGYTVKNLGEMKNQLQEQIAEEQVRARAEAQVPRPAQETVPTVIANLPGFQPTSLDARSDYEGLRTLMGAFKTTEGEYWKRTITPENAEARLRELGEQIREKSTTIRERMASSPEYRDHFNTRGGFRGFFRGEGVQTSGPRLLKQAEETVRTLDSKLAGIQTEMGFKEMAKWRQQ